jgi:hypothetical protein
MTQDSKTEKAEAYAASSYLDNQPLYTEHEKYLIRGTKLTAYLDGYAQGRADLVREAEAYCQQPTELIDANGESCFDEEMHQGHSSDAEDLTKHLKKLAEQP